MDEIRGAWAGDLKELLIEIGFDSGAVPQWFWPDSAHWLQFDDLSSYPPAARGGCFIAVALLPSIVVAIHGSSLG